MKLLVIAFIFSSLSLFGMNSNGLKPLAPEEQAHLNSKLIDKVRFANGRPSKVAELLKRGADANVKDKYGFTAFMYAVEGESLDVVNMLINSKADINACDPYGRTSLMYAIYKGNELIINRLLELSVEINARAHDSYFGGGETALIVAAREGNVALLIKLISLGADINAKNRLGKTVLMCEIESGRHKEIIDKLIELKADIYACDNDRKTILMYAAEAGNEAIFNRLLKLNVGIYNQDNGKVLLQHAVKGGNVAIVNALLGLNYSVNQSLLGIAAYNGRVALLDRLLELGLDIHACDGSLDTTIVMLAVQGKNLTFVNRLIDLGANIHAKARFGETALMYAAEVGSIEMFDRLIQLGAEINNKTIFDNNLLYYALRGKNLSIINRVMQLTNTFALTSREKEDITAIIEPKLKEEISPPDLKIVCTKHHQEYKTQLQSYYYRDCSTKRTFLILASIIGYRGGIEAILDVNPPCWYVQAQDYLGRTALMYSYSRDDKECTKMLISYIRDAITRELDWAAVWKRSMNLEDKAGLTLLDYALDRSDFELARDFVGLGCKYLARHLQKAASSGGKATVALLSSAGKIIDHTGKPHSLFK